jgi:transcriptional regulator GlxA family with amidase domain
MIPKVTNEMIGRIQDLMLEFIECPFKTNDFCRMLGVNRRTFELAFRERLDSSPAAYFRYLKAVHIRKELVSGNSKITDLLKKYGIGSFGHFGQYYKGLYSETMSDTRNRAFS